MARRLPKSLLTHDFDSSLLQLSASKEHFIPQHASRAYEWIEDLLRKSEPSKKQTTFHSTSAMVETMHQYDLIFQELIRQTHNYSHRIANLQEQAWKGVMLLIDEIIKTYHRHAKQTQHLQDEATSILQKKKNHELIEKQQFQEYNFEKASLRAHIRNIEGELESLSQENRILRRERNYLRSVVREFIQSGVDFSSEGEWGSSFAVTPTPGDLHSIQQHQLAAIQALDVGMNSALDDSLLEYNRFSSIVHELTQLWEKNECPQELKVASKSLARLKLMTEDYSPALTFSNIGMQVDEKDVYGVLDSDASANFLKISKIEVYPLIPWDDLLRVPPLPSQLSMHMSRAYEVKRIPSLEWLHQQIYAIYEDKIQYDKIIESTDMGRKKMEMSFAKYIHREYLAKRFHLPSNVDIQCALLLRAVEVYMDSSSRVIYICYELLYSYDNMHPGAAIRSKYWSKQFKAHLSFIRCV